jgi:hypothetical protein
MERLFNSSFKTHREEVSQELARFDEKMARSLTQVRDEAVKIAVGQANSDAQTLVSRETQILADKIADLQAKIKELEDRPEHSASPADTQYEMDKLWALEIALLKTTENSVLITNLVDKNGKPMPEIMRKPILDKALADAKKKADKVTHLTVNKALTQFSKITFISKEGADAVLDQFQKSAPINGMGRPIYARPDAPPEVRRLRAGLITAERVVKKYYKSIGEEQQHKVRIRFKRHRLFVDERDMARRLGDGTIVWQDKEFETIIRQFAKTLGDNDFNMD